jgi:hypothetical protein
MPADAAGSRHFARFYVNDETLVESVAEYVIRGIRDGAAAIVIATERHLASLDERWGNLQFDSASCRDCIAAVPYCPETSGADARSAIECVFSKL